MSIEVLTTHVQEYKSLLTHLAQLEDSEFEAAVTSDSYVGEGAKVVEQLGAVTAQKKQARHEDLKPINVPHDARWVHPEDSYLMDYIDREDKLRMLVSLEGGYASAFTMEWQRDKDREIVAAMFADSLTGKTGVTTTALPAAQTIAHGGVGMTLDKLLNGQEIMKDGRVQLKKEELHCAIGSRQWRQLIQVAEVKGIDTNAVKPLVSGQVTMFLGIMFHDYPDLPLSGTTRSCALWCKSGMHYGKWGGLESDIGLNRQKGNQQVTTQWTHGATRLEEVKVVEIECAE